jgi:hypothetical protein
MGDHMHKAGEWMLSYRFMTMTMKGNRIGTEDVSPEQIVTTVPNQFAPPATLRVVPTEMTMDMHMFGLMYAPSNWLTLMAMASYQINKMDATTYQGMMGATPLGNFSTETSGMTDTRVLGLFRLLDSGAHHVHFQAGVSLPTGSITETGSVLAPSGMTMNVRLPYPMQLGSGTYDAIGGVTYTGKSDKWSWGAQYQGVFRQGTNDESYRLGNDYQTTGWLAYLWKPPVSTSVRLAYQRVDNIHGADPMIALPTQTAQPDMQGRKVLNAYLGVNMVGEEGWLRGQRLAFEVMLPVRQDLDGPQLKTDWGLIAGWQYAF